MSTFDLAAPAPRQRGPVRINVLGPLYVQGRRVRSVKPLEFVVALALAGGRMTRDALLGRIYEYEACSSALPTLCYRARKLGIEVDYDPSSQCYTLRHQIRVDVLDVLDLARRKQAREALWRYGGPCLASSNSPFADALRRTVEEELVKAVLDSGDSELTSRACRFIDHSELAEHATRYGDEPLATVLGRSYLTAIDC